MLSIWSSDKNLKYWMDDKLILMFIARIFLFLFNYT